MSYRLPRDVDANVLHFLVEQRVEESSALEFKAQLPGRSDADKGEFLKDISALANSGGGAILFGIEEKDGAAVAVPGLQIESREREQQRMEDMLLSGIAPRLPALAYSWCEAENGSAVLAIGVPSSWVGPHLVEFKKKRTFWARHSKGKYQLDITDIRAAILGGVAQLGRLAEFRASRVGHVVADRTSAPLVAGPMLVLHLVPAAPVGPEFDVAVAVGDQPYGRWRALYSRGADSRWNVDGLLFLGSGPPGRHRGITQVFRGGAVESVMTLAADSEKRIWPERLEHGIAEGLEGYVERLREVGVAGPLVAFASLCGVGGFSLRDGGERWRDEHDVIPTFDRDVVLLPELIVEGPAFSASDARPIVRTAWQAAGHADSVYVGTSGEWSPAGGEGRRPF